ncbi:MAG: hypothetical protein HUU57_06140 [Bdellovibrio sp.]|nr:hypothetical protein [Bdellovibrio sp.]
MKQKILKLFSLSGSAVLLVMLFTNCSAQKFEALTVVDSNRASGVDKDPVASQPEDVDQENPAPSSPNVSEPTSGDPKVFYPSSIASIPLPAVSDITFNTQNKYRAALTKVGTAYIISGSSHKYYTMTLTQECTPWSGAQPGTCLPPQFEQTSTGPQKIRLLIPPGVKAKAYLQAVALRMPDGTAPSFAVGVHEHPEAVFAGTSPAVFEQFQNGFSSQQGAYNFDLQLVNSTSKVSNKSHFVYLTLVSEVGIDFPVTQFNFTIEVVDKDAYSQWLTSCGDNDLNSCVL